MAWTQSFRLSQIHTQLSRLCISCICGHDIETTTYFFYHCLNCHCARKTLLQKIHRVSGNILEQTDSVEIFFHEYWRQLQENREKEGASSLHSFTSTFSRTFRQLFATGHLRWLLRIFNHIVCTLPDWFSMRILHFWE